MTWESYVCIAVILGFIVSFQFGLGSISNIIEDGRYRIFICYIAAKISYCCFNFSELFDSTSQTAIKTLTNIVSWTCKFGSAIAFPNLQLGWSELVYVPFLIVSVVLAVAFLVFLPETRGIDQKDTAKVIGCGFQCGRGTQKSDTDLVA